MYFCADFGEQVTCSTSYKFTGYERDAETGIDYAFARYYNPRMGRFMSGDPIGGDALDPQSHNRYSYTRSNPVNLIDPLGLSPADSGFCEASMSSCAGGSGLSGPGRGGFGSAASQLWDTAMTQYLQEVYNSAIRIDPDGIMYRTYVPTFMRPPSDCEETGPDEATCYDNMVTSWGAPIQVAVWQSTGGNSSWAWTFTKEFFGNFSLKGARQPGESWSACVDRSQQALLGDKGTLALNVLTPLGAFATAYTTPFQQTTDIPGVSVIRSAWEADLAANARAGTGLANFATKASGSIARVSGIVTAVATGIKGGFYAACTY